MKVVIAVPGHVRDNISPRGSMNCMFDRKNNHYLAAVSSRGRGGAARRVPPPWSRRPKPPWSVVRGPWSVVRGPWSVVGGPCFGSLASKLAPPACPQASLSSVSALLYLCVREKKAFFPYMLSSAAGGGNILSSAAGAACSAVCDRQSDACFY